MRIGIIGIRGVPNFHGGFEQFAEFLSEYISKAGHLVYVYNSHNHPYQESLWKKVQIIHKYDPEFKIGTVGQFIYDYNCILDARKRNFDIILQLGYTSSSVWHKLLPKKSLIVTNMDGLEWKRSKYSKMVQNFLKIAEKWAVFSSDYLVSDSVGIQNYLKEKYNKDSTYIAYGAEPYVNEDATVLKEYGVENFNYNLLIARMEPENNIEVILDGVAESHNQQKFLVIGKNDTNSFGKKLTAKYKNNTNIIFLGGIYNQNHLNQLRYYSNLYFHGHSVGGTNPSLLEAMACKALIIAHKNIFNEAIIQDDGFYFTNVKDVTDIINSINKEGFKNKIEANYTKVIQQFSLDKINEEYLTLFKRIMKK
jgi:glycosyltransferase involved in cell wall biosynthesis